MLLRLVSDIHTEFLGPVQKSMVDHFDREILKPLPTDKDTILIVAGDLGSMHKFTFLCAALPYFSERFKHVFYIPGNHEYYGGSLVDTNHDIAAEVAKYPNITFSAQGVFAFGGQRFIMSTLWASFNNANDYDMGNAYIMMNDYVHIQGLQRGLRATPKDTYELHTNAVDFFKDEMQKGDVVITHHLPSFKSISEIYLAGPYSKLNGAYASDLEALMLEKQPKLWVHGHTHDSKDYHIGSTRIVCNPVGYRTDRNVKYQNDLVIEI